MKCVVTYSLCRSGQHAIINWLCKQSGNNIHFGNVRQSVDERMIASNYIIYKDGKDIKTHYIQKEKVVLGQPETPDPNDYELCIMSAEDKFVEHIQIDMKHKIAVILRDPYNLFASRLQTYNRLTPKYGIPVFDIPFMWVSHAKNCIMRKDIIPIYFNQWVSSKAYRKKLAEVFGLEFTDNGFNDTPLFAGSAFKGERKVLERWKQMKERVENHITPEIEELSQQLFGEIK